MNFKARWVRHNGQALWLYRRILFMWLRYEPFTNKERNLERKLNKLATQMEETYEKLREAHKERNLIGKDISRHRDALEHLGPIQIMKLKWFRPSVVPPVDPYWQKYENTLRGSTSLADSALGAAGVQVKGNVNPDDYDIDLEEGHDFQVVAEQSVPVVRRNDNNNRNKKNRNNQQNN